MFGSLIKIGILPRRVISVPRNVIQSNELIQNAEHDNLQLLVQVWVLDYLHQNIDRISWWQSSLEIIWLVILVVQSLVHVNLDHGSRVHIALLNVIFDTLNVFEASFPIVA